MRSVHDQGRSLLESPLEYPGLPVRTGGQVAMRLWMYPSFTPEISWAVIKQGEELFLRRITFDHRRSFFSPETYGAEVGIEASLLTEPCSVLSEFNLPPDFGRSPGGIDGCTFGLEVTLQVGKARLEWWETPPAGVEGVAEWHRRVRQMFDSGLPAYSADVETVA